jgi:selenoprotein W-related protein
MENHPRVEIRYCTQCRWILRAGWLAQELLSTFDTDLGEVALVPGTGGIFEVRVDDELVWSRKEQGRFPEAKELKQRVRDRDTRIASPERLSRLHRKEHLIHRDSLLQEPALAG